MPRMANDRLAEGFRGQMLYFAPANVRAELAKHPLAADLYAPDLGWFPRALHHYRERVQGSDEHILIYCRSGRGWFEIDGQERILLSGQALLIPRGKPHRYGANETNPWSIHWVHFVGDTALFYSNKFKSPEFKVQVSQLVGKKLEGLYRECYRALSTGHTLNNYLLVAHIFRHLLGVLLLENDCINSGSTSPPHDATKSIDFMRSNLSRTLSLNQLAQQAGLSPSRYSALFRAQTGTSPVEHHIGLRVQAACRLLTTTELSVKEICARLGFNDPFYFSRLFGNIMGVPPSTYRRAAKG